MLNYVRLRSLLNISATSSPKFCKSFSPSFKRIATVTEFSFFFSALVKLFLFVTPLVKAVFESVNFCLILLSSVPFSEDNLEAIACFATSSFSFCEAAKFVVLSSLVER